MKGRKLPALPAIELSIIEEQVPELLAFDKGSLDYIAVDGSVLAAPPRQRQAQARVRRARHRAPSLYRPGAHLHLSSTRTTRSSAAMRRNGSRCGARSALGFNTPSSSRCSMAARAARESAAAAGHERLRPEAAAEIGVRSCRCAGAARPLRLQGSRRRRLPGNARRQAARAHANARPRPAEPRRRHAVAQEHGGDRPQDDDQHRSSSTISCARARPAS